MMMTSTDQVRGSDGLQVVQTWGTVPNLVDLGKTVNISSVILAHPAHSDLDPALPEDVTLGDVLVLKSEAPLLANKQAKEQTDLQPSSVRKSTTLLLQAMS